MLAKSSVLLVESDPYVALDLAATIEELDGRVVGPTADAIEALALLGREPVAAAIVEWHLSGHSAAPVVDSLAERNIPFVIHSTGQVDGFDRERHSAIPVLMKPLQPRTVVACLVVEIRKSRRAASEVREENLNNIRDME